MTTLEEEFQERVRQLNITPREVLDSKQLTGIEYVSIGLIATFIIIRWLFR